MIFILLCMLLNILFQIRSLEARRNSLLMALETERQKNLRDAIAETEFRLGNTELRLAQMRKSKARVIDESYSLIYVIQIRLKTLNISLFLHVG
jgi:phosphoribosyl-ATP pyrophosphohydrolase